MRGPHLAIVLPGRGYKADAPALRLPLLALQQIGAEPLVVEYPDSITRERGTWTAAHHAAEEQVSAALSKHRPTQVTFLAKSLGTRAPARLDPTAPSDVEATLQGLSTLVHAVMEFSAP